MYELIRAPGFARLPLIVEDFVKDAGAIFSGELGVRGRRQAAWSSGGGVLRGKGLVFRTCLAGDPA